MCVRTYISSKYFWGPFWWKCSENASQIKSKQRGWFHDPCIGGSKQTKVINFLLERREIRSKMWKSKQHIHRTSNSSRIKWGAILCSAMTLEFCWEFSGREIQNWVQLAMKAKKSTADYRKIKSFGANCVKIHQAFLGDVEYWKRQKFAFCGPFSCAFGV